MEYVDGDFVGWEVVTWVKEGVGLDADISQEASGGNPGNWRKIAHNLYNQPGWRQIRVYHFSGLTADPGSLGELTRLAFSLDVKFVSIVGRVVLNGMGGGFCVRQSGNIFELTSGGWVTNADTSWREKAGVATSPDDFVFADVNGTGTSPTIDLGGGAIELGFFTYNRTNDPGDLVLTAGVDNFAVTVEAAGAAAPARVRSSMAEDLGSILDSAQLIPVEPSGGEAFLPDADLDPGVLYDFKEFLRPDQAALRYYPVPTENDEFLSTYRVETKLRRMARAFPDPLTITAQDAVGSASATAQQWCEHVFGLWAARYPWFTYETVPVIAYPDDSEPTAQGLIIPQTLQNRRTMLELAEQLLTPFAILRQNSAGNIEVIPRYGPDAPSAPVLTLAPEDVISISTSKPDPTSAINAAVVTGRVRDFVAGQEVMQQACTVFGDASYQNPPAECGGTYYDLGNPIRLGPRLWPTGEDVLLATGDLVFLDLELEMWSQLEAGTSYPTSHGTVYTSKYQEVTLSDDAGSGDTSLTVDALAEDIIAGQYIQFDDLLVQTNVTASAGATSLSVYALNAALSSGSVGVTSRDTVTLSGNFVQFATIEETVSQPWSMGAFSATGGFTLSARYDAEADAIELQFFPVTTRTRPSGAFQDVLFFYRVTLGGYARAYIDSGLDITARFGYASDDSIPTEGGNLVAISQDAYGIREAQINLDIYEFDVETAQNIARWFVWANINPRIRRTVEQSAHNRYPVQFDHAGLQVALPNGEVGLVEGRSYSDSFSPEGGSLASTFRCVIADESQPVIDLNTCYIQDENGAYLQFEDGAFWEDEQCDTSAVEIPADEPATPSAIDTTSLAADAGWAGEARGGGALSASLLNWHEAVPTFVERNVEPLGEYTYLVGTGNGTGGGSAGLFNGRKRGDGYWDIDAYHTMRYGWTDANALILELRAVPDPDLVAGLARWAEAIEDSHRVGWRNTGPELPSGSATDRLCVVSYWGQGKYQGTDRNWLQETKLWELAEALRLIFYQNRNLPAPSGTNYKGQPFPSDYFQQRYNVWNELLENQFKPKWFGPADWEAYYKGWEHDSEGNFERADAVGEPFVMRIGGVHTYMSGLRACWYRYLYTGDTAWKTRAEALWDAMDTGVDATTTFKRISTPYGEGLIIPRGVQSTASVNDDSYAQPTVYLHYILQSLVDLRLSGFYPAKLTDTFLTKIARTLSARWLTATSSTSTGRGMGGNGTVTLADGSTMAAPPNVSSYPAYSHSTTVRHGFGCILPWDAVGDLTAAFTAAQNANGGYTSPVGPFVPNGLVLSGTL